MTLAANPSEDCKLPDTVLTGYAAIDFVDSGTSGEPVYEHALLFIVRAPGQAYVHAMAVRQ